MDTSLSPRTRKRRVWVRIALVAQALLAGLLLTEGAARVRARVADKPYSASRTSGEWRDTLASVTATLQQQALGAHALAEAVAGVRRDENVVLNPYVGYDWTHLPSKIHDELEHFQSPKGVNGFDVIIVGGSVAGEFGNLVGRSFGRMLRQDARLGGRQVHVHSHGRAGYKQPQQVLWITYLLSLGYEPDLVIDLDGFNELALSAENVLRRGNPVHPSIGHWANLVNGGATDRDTLDVALRVREAQNQAQALFDGAIAWKLHYSAVAGPLVSSRLKRAQAEFTRAQDDYTTLLTNKATDGFAATVLGPPFDGDVMATSVRNWSESSRSLAAICAARSIRYMHVLQPTLHDKGSKTLTEAESAKSQLRAEWIEAVQVGYPKLRQAGAELAEDGVFFFDASRVFESATQTLYRDGCHFSVEGNEILARAIADAFLASIDQPLADPAVGRPTRGMGRKNQAERR